MNKLKMFNTCKIQSREREREGCSSIEQTASADRQCDSGWTGNERHKRTTNESTTTTKSRIGSQTAKRSPPCARSIERMEKNGREKKKKQHRHQLASQIANFSIKYKKSRAV